jgi:hypothetical protein
MTDCERMPGCEFFRIYGSDEDKKLALAGFVRMYCKGDAQSTCMRKMVSKDMGGPQHVPKNLMPTGRPLSGTTSEAWPEDVKKVIKMHMSKH